MDAAAGGEFVYTDPSFLARRSNLRSEILQKQTVRVTARRSEGSRFWATLRWSVQLVGHITQPMSLCAVECLQRFLRPKGSGNLIGEGPDKVSGRLNLRRPLQPRSAMPGGHGADLIFGGGRGRWSGCAGEGSKGGHAEREIPVLVVIF